VDFAAQVWTLSGNQKKALGERSKKHAHAAQMPDRDDPAESHRVWAHFSDLPDGALRGDRATHMVSSSHPESLPPLEQPYRFINSFISIIE
jgi:hypothetical protein